MNKGTFQQFTYTQDYISQIGFDVFRRMCIDTYERGGHSPLTHYCTFYGDSYETGMVDLFVLDTAPGHLFITAPEQELDDAIEWIKNKNAHLVFGEVKRGQQGDDFIKNRMSAQMGLTLKEPK